MKSAKPFDPRRDIIRICGRPGANDRPALPSGHSATWSAITDGTVLQGSPYPYPVFEP